ncbi:MAG: hypothetical protein GY719_26610 [bacterium]|nr:hypothetical protein [bacterium]
MTSTAKSTVLFERRTARVLLWVGGVALAITLFFLVFADPAMDESSWRADSFSRSLIGYHALTRFLEGEVPVLISRHFSAVKASAEKPLLILEPPEGSGELTEMVTTALSREAPVVVVLPKWQGTPMGGGWVRALAPLPESAVTAVLVAALGNEEAGGIEVVRSERGEARWDSSLLEPTQTAGLSLRVPRQLLRDPGVLLEPVVARGEELLVARVSETSLYLVSDPDLLNTGGLGLGDNAALAHGFLIDRLAPSAIVVDESLHGYRQATSVWRALLEPPLLAFSLHLIGLAALVAWAGGGRFGRPLAPPPRVPPGKHSLIDNTARLLGLREHLKHSAEEYLRLTVSKAASVWRPRGSFREQVSTLAGLGRRRGNHLDLEELGRAVARLPARGGDPRRVLALARDLYRWREEITDRDGRS